MSFENGFSTISSDEEVGAKQPKVFEESYDEDREKIKEFWKKLGESGLQEKISGLDYDLFFSGDNGTRIVAELKYKQDFSTMSPLDKSFFFEPGRRSAEEMVEICRQISKIVKEQTNKKNPNDVLLEISGITMKGW
ncbi:MAG: hypothetical protein WC827_00170 [Candidatus Paceibacterota bacterium]|jgi:hypothetical protein